ncbi:hypothetical protein [Conchiformibius steedae]|uniref:hypothetical protein n=1 Tax=Conchiformibius steedae TaxID=153493 RepID=UPI0026E991F6|nr:hypothetical protein [Conchiformibius steedae]
MKVVIVSTVFWLIVLSVLIVIFKGETEADSWRLMLPVMIYLGIQTAMQLMFWRWLKGRTPEHAKAIKARHPTLGDFTNIKYTEWNIIGIGDLILMVLMNGLLTAVLVWWYRLG